MIMIGVGDYAWLEKPGRWYIITITAQMYDIYHDTED